MGFAPGPAAKLYGAGVYDAFPSVGRRPDTGTILVTWPTGPSHAAGSSAIKGARSTDDGRTWSSIFTTHDVGGAAPVTASFVGVVWDETRWLGCLMVVRSGVRSWSLMQSTNDGASWSPVGAQPVARPASVSWWYPSNMARDDDGTLIHALYGARPADGSGWVIIVTTSTDDGATWSAPAFLTVPGVRLTEPMLAKGPDGWVLACRDVDNFTVYRAVSTSPTGWGTAKLEQVLGASGAGQTAMVTAADGTMLMQLRQNPAVDDYHGVGSWAASTDGGHTWVEQPGWPDPARYFMYGGWVALPDGSVLGVWSSEDNPDNLALTSPASIYFARWQVTRVDAELVWVPLDEGASRESTQATPAVRVTAPGATVVTRAIQDWFTGDIITEQVRITDRDVSGSLVALDPEIQQGYTYTYSAGGMTSDPITVPELPDTVLVHPLKPEFSLQVGIVSDSDRAYPGGQNVTDVPLRRFPIVTTSGARGTARGETTVHTFTLVDKARMDRLLADNIPLFWSHHVGLDMPSWVAVGDVKEARFVQQCSHCLDDDSDPAQRRHWTLPWVEQARPTALELPRRRRIRDLPAVKISELPPVPIQEL